MCLPYVTSTPHVSVQGRERLHNPHHRSLPKGPGVRVLLELVLPLPLRLKRLGTSFLQMALQLPWPRMQQGGGTGDTLHYFTTRRHNPLHPSITTTLHSPTQPSTIPHIPLQGTTTLSHRPRPSTPPRPASTTLHKPPHAFTTLHTPPSPSTTPNAPQSSAPSRDSPQPSTTPNLSNPPLPGKMLPCPCAVGRL